jgi:tetratricopeptide (TPR) repeat protein
MRKAYGGRAAAFEQKGDYERAVQDYNQLVLLCAAEVEILGELAVPDRASFFVEAADAFRARAKALQKLDKTAAADKDRKQAAKLDLDAWKLTAGKAKPAEGTGGGKLAAWKPAPVGRLLLSNQWTGPVTLRIDGTDYRLKANEEKTVEKLTGPFEYELVESGQSAKGTVEPGRTFRVRVGN